MLEIKKDSYGNETYHHKPKYKVGDELRLPNLYGDPKRILLEFLPPDNARVAPWTGVYGGDSAELAVGTKLRIVHMEPYRSMLESFLWTFKESGTLDVQWSPAATPHPTEHP